MSTPPNPTTVTTPNSKLDHLCERANAVGGALVNHGAVARALDLAPSRISQLFGHGQEAAGTTLPAGLEGRLVKAFTDDGVLLELGWLRLPLATFISRFAAPVANRPAQIETPWRATESNAEPALVEFRLHDPEPSNRVLALPATLLFGRVEFDDDGFALTLREATAALESETYRPAEAATPAPHEAAPSPHLQRIAGGFRITGPHQGEALDGDPLAGAPLITVQRRDDCPPDAPDNLAIIITTGRRSFIVTALDPSAADPIDPGTKDALVNIIINKSLGTTATQRPILARATLCRDATPST